MTERKMLRLDRLLASLGYGTRRTVEDLFHDGRVSVGGQTARDGSRKACADDVRVDGEALDRPEGILVMLHKPAGYACSHDPGESPLVYDLLPAQWLGRNPVPTTIGRLDRDTTGVLLVTDNMPLVHRMTTPKHGVEKTYQVTLDGPLREEYIPLFASGTLVLEGETKPCRAAQLSIIDPTHAELVLHEGKFHQVKRMFAAIGLAVTTLHRSRFGPYTLGELAPGRWIDVPRPNDR